MHIPFCSGQSHDLQQHGPKAIWRAPTFGRAAPPRSIGCGTSSPAVAQNQLSTGARPIGPDRKQGHCRSFRSPNTYTRPKWEWMNLACWTYHILPLPPFGEIQLLCYEWILISPQLVVTFTGNCDHGHDCSHNVVLVAIPELGRTDWDRLGTQKENIKIQNHLVSRLVRSLAAKKGKNM
jgi:hypothetical protein